MGVFPCARARGGRVVGWDVPEAFSVARNVVSHMSGRACCSPWESTHASVRRESSAAATHDPPHLAAIFPPLPSLVHLDRVMSHHQPDPHAKRQRASFFDTAPNLNPVRKPPPALYQPSSSSTLPSLADHDPSSSTHHNKAHQSTTSSKKRERPSAPNGNFRGYYARRRGVVALGPVSAPDERLALIPAAWLEGKKVLDVGCNGGVVTVEVAQTRRAARVTGVDIDAELVRAARKQGASASPA